MAATSGAAALHDNVVGLFDAIRAKAGVSGAMTFAQAASAVRRMSAGGATSSVAALRSRIYDLEAALEGLVSMTDMTYSAPEYLERATYMPNLKRMHSSAFAACSSVLRDVALDSLEIVPSSAFEGFPALEHVSIPTASIIYMLAFADCAALRSVEMEMVEVISASAFAGCTALSGHIYFGSATSIGTSAFAGCTSITVFEAPAATSIATGAFYGCTALEEVYLNAYAGPSQSNTTPPFLFSGCVNLEKVEMPTLTRLNGSWFRGLSRLREVYMPAILRISGSAFAGCTSLEVVSLEGASSVGAYAFSGCVNLPDICLPASDLVINSYAFLDCTGLGRVEAPRAAYISTAAFRNCVYLTELLLNQVSAVPALYNSTVFSSTPIGGYSDVAGDYGSVYVPKSLYADFLTANSWSRIADRIVSV